MFCRLLPTTIGRLRPCAAAIKTKGPSGAIGGVMLLFFYLCVLNNIVCDAHAYTVMFFLYFLVHRSAAKGPAALTQGQVKASAIANFLGAILVSLFILGFLLWVSAGTLFYVVAAIICILCCIFPVAKQSINVCRVYRDINMDVAYAEANRDQFMDEREVDREGDEGGSDGEVELVDAEQPGTSEKNAVTFDEEVLDAAEKPMGAKMKEMEQTLFQLWETTRVTQPHPWVCYLGLCCELIFLFLWPVTNLFVAGNNNVGFVYVIVSVFSFLRHYFDPSCILAELGCMNNIEVQRQTDAPSKKKGLERMFTRRSLIGPDKTLVMKARLSEIIGDITRSSSVGRWMWVFGVWIFICFLLFLSAVQSDGEYMERFLPGILMCGCMLLILSYAPTLRPLFRCAAIGKASNSSGR